jgi:hypothetical protein
VSAREFHYERRRPERTTLYEVVRDNLATLYAASEEGFASALPSFVKRELESYLECGLLCRGFAVLDCTDPECRARHLLAFSCKGRAFCPSCLGRRMAQTAANLIDHVLPPDVPLRQFVLTVPFELRARLAYDGELLGGVSRELATAVQDFYRRRFEQLGVRGGKTGSVTVVQRSNSDLRLNPHYHQIALDGVYAEPEDEEAVPEFHPLPHLTSQDVADVLQLARVRILRFLKRQGAIVETRPLEVGDAGGATAEQGLQQLAAAAVTGQAPAGPELRQRPPVPLPPPGEVRVTGALLASDGGFTLHAATVAAGSDAVGREALVRYALRPPLAQERLRRVNGDLVEIALKRPFSDGTYAVQLDPLSLLCRLVATVPPPRCHTVRYAGVLAPASRLRARIVPPRSTENADAADADPEHAAPAPGGSRCGWRPWAELMKRVFHVELEKCLRCGSPMKLRAVITAPANVARYLRHVDEATELPPRAPARDPPYFRSPVIRRKLAEQLVLVA